MSSFPHPPSALAIQQATTVNLYLDEMLPPGGNANAVLVLALAQRLAESANTSVQLEVNCISVTDSLATAAHAFRCVSKRPPRPPSGV